MAGQENTWIIFAVIVSTLAGSAIVLSVGMLVMLHRRKQIAKLSPAMMGSDQRVIVAASEQAKPTGTSPPAELSSVEVLVKIPHFQMVFSEVDMPPSAHTLCLPEEDSRPTSVQCGEDDSFASVEVRPPPLVSQDTMAMLPPPALVEEEEGDAVVAAVGPQLQRRPSSPDHIRDERPKMWNVPLPPPLPALKSPPVSSSGSASPITREREDDPPGLSLPRPPTPGTGTWVDSTTLSSLESFHRDALFAPLERFNSAGGMDEVVEMDVRHRGSDEGRPFSGMLLLHPTSPGGSLSVSRSTRTSSITNQSAPGGIVANPLSPAIAAGLGSRQLTHATWSGSPNSCSPVSRSPHRPSKRPPPMCTATVAAVALPPSSVPSFTAPKPSPSPVEDEEEAYVREAAEQQQARSALSGVLRTYYNRQFMPTQ